MQLINDLTPTQPRPPLPLNSPPFRLITLLTLSTKAPHRSILSPILCSTISVTIPFHPYQRTCSSLSTLFPPFRPHVWFTKPVFLIACMRFYNAQCLSVGRSVCRSVGRSVCRSINLWVRNSAFLAFTGGIYNVNFTLLLLP